MKITDQNVKETLARSFKAWQDVTPLTFQKLDDNDENADIIIDFYSGIHGDSYPFDGPGKIVAHAFYPFENIGSDGDLHFDNDEIWAIDGEPETTDLSWTSLHELGHSIGLDHTNEDLAIMWPWYPGYRPENKLHQNDIETVQSIYGGPKKRSEDLINICNTRNIDAVVFDNKTEKSYFFKKDQVWEISRRRKIIKQDTISNMWPGLENNIDAAYSTKNGDVIFFKGNSWWRYQNFTKMEGPHPLVTHINNIFESGLHKIEAAMIWVKDQRTYFFNKEHYWRYDEDEKAIDPGYPKRSSALWKNIKFPVDSVMSWRRQKTFFFNKENFYAFNNKKNVFKIKKDQSRQRISHFIKTCRK